MTQVKERGQSGPPEPTDKSDEDTNFVSDMLKWPEDSTQSPQQSNPTRTKPKMTLGYDPMTSETWLELDHAGDE